MSLTRRALLGFVAGLPLALKAGLSGSPRVVEFASYEEIWGTLILDGSPPIEGDVVGWIVSERTGWRRSPIKAVDYYQP